MAQHQGSIGAAVLWMFILSLLLFWLPLVGPFIAGLVGGKKAGNVGSAVMAVCLPALIFAGFIVMFSSVLLGMPLLGLFAGMGAFVLALVHVVPMLVGAVVGGATA
jgi:hypothetical protein